MRIFIRILIVAIVFISCLWVGYKFDAWMYHQFTNGSIINDAVKVILKVVIVGFTVSVIIGLSILVSMFVNILIESFLTPKRKVVRKK